MKIINIEVAKKYLFQFQKTQKEQKRLKNTLDRTSFLANLVGNPQNRLKIIHIAGTSGKGSTSTILSEIFVAQGFKTGLSLSPHIYDTHLSLSPRLSVAFL